MVKQTILSMLLLFAAIVAHAQGGQVNGQVKDAMGESVIGATLARAATTGRRRSQIRTRTARLVST